MALPFLRRSNMPRLLASLLCCATLILISLVTLYWQTWSMTRQQAQTAAERAMTQIDSALHHSTLAAKAALPLASRPCREVARELRVLVATSPYVRSVNLSRNGRLYCSSIFDEIDLKDRLQNSQHELLRLEAVTQLGRKPSLLFYHLSEGDHAVVVAINPYHLSKPLQWHLAGPHSWVQIGKQWLDLQGKVYDGQPPRLRGFNYRLDSTTFGYSLNQGFPLSAVLAMTLQKQGSMVLLILALGGLAGLATYRWWSHISTPTQELRRAIIKQEFVPYLQPIVVSQNGQLHGCEVLMRWQHHRQGLIRPDLFIPLAEESGLIILMTQTLMQQVRLQFAPHAAVLPPRFHFSFNICARHCQQLSLLDDCRSFLAAFTANPITLVLELTERELITPNHLTERLFEELRQMGVRIGLDDFGTGHSSLTYLQQFHVDYLKIDQSFVAMIGTNALSRHILDSTISLATRLGLQTIAEGVETQEQADFLVERQVDYLQGYLYGRPLTPQQFLQQLSPTPAP
ncbi:cyclic diguanylate phosphodiesterase [Aeromonas hydrophila]|uniref:cyclic diguanylate phosphodiesterase n=1 Tax=Aeromonas hydrophila TaxID=644 RepID=UPI00214D7AFC|nr:cyclic diguanylate phosphodiesterase [Aeromonas hydrophila]MCR3907929.1 cyclic diguanylate phosphodiesterase [Aeromonas hydrophila]